MVNIVIDGMEQQARANAERTKYLVRARKRNGFPLFSLYHYPRTIFRHIRWTPIEEASVLLINAHRELLLLTSPLHPEDAEAIRREWIVFPDIWVYPVVALTGRGTPYQRVFCVRTFPKRKTTRLPRVANSFKNYRWVVYQQWEWGQYVGLLISEEPKVVPYPCDHATEAYFITASDAEDEMHFTDLRHLAPKFTVPLSYSCL